MAGARGLECQRTHHVCIEVANQVSWFNGRDDIKQVHDLRQHDAVCVRTVWQQVDIEQVYHQPAMCCKLRI